MTIGEAYKKERDIIENATDQYYDIEVIIGNQNLSDISMSRNSLRRSRLYKYRFVKLVNINGLGVGQAHFITDDGHYLLLPWCYIISMIPSK